MQGTEPVDYVNTPSSSLSNYEDARKIEKQSRDSVLRVCRVVGLSLGLLCILQAILNISLRLQQTSEPCSAVSNHCNQSATTDWAVEDLVAIRYQLIRQRQQLQKTHDNLEAQYRDCSQGSGGLFNVHLKVRRLLRERRMRDQISQQNHAIWELKWQRDRLQMQISKLDPSIPRCPPDWISEQSSCYVLSSRKNTWNLAQQDCLNRDAHLVTVDSYEEQLLIQTVGFLVDRVWIGLRNNSSDGTFTWDDGAPLYKRYWHEFTSKIREVSCVYLDQQVKTMYARSPTSCKELNNWLCERAPK